jgi:hypothetical protein
MKRHDLFPSRYLKASDLKGRAHIVQIKAASVETLKSQKGEEAKCILRFERVKKGLVLNLTNYNAIADIAGDETNNWPGTKIEIYPTVTEMGGKQTDCIRIRPPSQSALPTAPPPAAPPDELADDEMADEEIPF